jgi:DNA-binding SARP family transcriptional activator
VAPLREALRRRLVDAYTHLSAASAAPAAAVAGLAARAVAVDPYNEYLHRRAVTAYHAAGQPHLVRPLRAAHTARLAAVGEDPDPDQTRGDGAAAASD